MRTISKVVHADLHAVYRWIRKFAEENYEEPESASDAIVVELDEMWHYIQKKKQNLDMEDFSRNTRQLIDWECGGRDKWYIFKTLRTSEKMECFGLFC